MSRTRGFTLIELLVVLAIMAAVFGLVGSSFAKGNQRLQSVRSAANELAATCRRARGLAMENKATYAVVFNIQNEPASSGRVLNNRSGGHWYRILRPAGAGDSSTVDNIQRLWSDPYGPYTIADYQDLIARSWHDDAHVLPAGRVRFLALTDMDWGDYQRLGAHIGREKSASASYPRPWFGWFDAASRRLMPWGGYDPAIPASGFYYWGNPVAGPADANRTYAVRDPQPVGCANAADRRLDQWVPANLNGVMARIPESSDSVLLYAKDSPRPLVNAAWRDASLLFLSTGQVRWGKWLPARHCGGYSDIHPDGNRHRGIGERCNSQCEPTWYSNYSLDQNSQAEASSFDAAAGGWYITLAPDSADDRDTFADAREAMESLLPAFRVFVSRFGEVRVVPVSRIPKWEQSGVSLSPFPDSADWWATGNNTIRNFGSGGYVDGSLLASDNLTGLGAASGRPITDFITPDMLAKRQVWMK